MRHPYNPAKWYWNVGNRNAGGAVFSSAAAAYVQPNDAAYVAWAESHMATKIATDGLLAHALWNVGLLTAGIAAGVNSLGPTGAMAADEAVSMLMAFGVKITSTGSPSISGQYAGDPATRNNLQGLLVGYLLRTLFPGGGQTFPYADISGAAYVVTQPQLQAIASAIEDYYAALAVWAPKWATDASVPPPVSSVTIA